MKVSVIIPVYNVERYLTRCLDSVLAAVREVTSVEVICVNDGSTDGSAAILERYTDSVKIITKSNGGLGSARNAALDVATGDYIMFVDSDDWIPAYAISMFVSVAEASKAALVVSTSFLKDDGAKPFHPFTPSPLHLSAWRMRPTDWIAGRKIQYCAWNKFYRVDLFATRRYPATIYEDFPVTTDILCEVGEFAAVDEPLYVYCTNEGASSLVRSSFNDRKLKDSLAVVRMTLETAARQTDPRLVRFALRQAANAHSSTVGQVWKSHDEELRRAFLKAHAELLREHPALKVMLSLKAAFRLWRMKCV